MKMGALLLFVGFCFGGIVAFTVAVFMGKYAHAGAVSSIGLSVVTGILAFIGFSALCHRLGK